MDDRLALGDLATLSVDRDEDLLVQRIGQQRMQLLLAAAAGVAGLPLFGNGCATAGGQGPPCNRPGRPPYPASFALAIRLCLLSQRTGHRKSHLLSHSSGIVNMVSCYNSNESSAPRHVLMSRPSLPARSLRGRPASLRTVPDGAGVLLRKPLIWRVLLVIRPVISSVEKIFLPALRERGSGRGVCPLQSAAAAGLGMPLPLRSRGRRRSRAAI